MHQMLRKLDLCYGIILDDRTRVLFPWHQLDTIQCPCSPTYSPARLISFCTNLKSAHLVHDYDVKDNQQPIPKPLPTSINTLVLETEYSSTTGFCSSIERCLRQLQLNSLRSLDIQTHNGTLEALTHFESFIKLVSEYKSLTSLRLCNVAFCNEISRGSADKGTLELLENLTSLESLEIVEGFYKADDSCILQDVFVQALTVSRVGNHYQQDTLILPVLQHLSFKGQGWHLSDKTLVDLVRSRWRPLTSEPDVDVPVESDSVTSLTSVQFVLTKRRCDPEVFQPLVNMAAAGLKVTVIDSFGRVV
jgi:hypothetical protein